MGFDIIAQADPIATRKDTEFVQVQVVHLTPDAKFPKVVERVQVEMRLVFEGQHGLVGTKQAFVFENAEDVQDMIAALEGALGVYNGSAVAALRPVPAPVVVAPPVKAIPKIGRANGNGAGAPAAAAKPVAKKRPVKKIGA
jgi:hypothetical protein